MELARRIVVFGTAGHVDHGKSALVKALTGTDPDRLAEEKARGLTIDLGFAWLSLANGNVASFVDVPGHEDFIKNMLAGAGGVDATLMVIAADEGPMPQTREHLAILDLLGIEHAAVAVTKIDLVDAEWLQLVTDEIAALLRGTRLAGAPVVAVSAVDNRGLDQLTSVLADIVSRAPAPIDRARPRMSIDRAFSMPGFGTVVTGTLREGVLRTGDIVTILPAGLGARIRGLHSYGQPVDTASPGTRAALNLTGIDAVAVHRGDVAVLGGGHSATRLVDVELQLLPAAGEPLSHDTELHMHHGAAEIPVRVRLIGADAVEPGQAAPAQLRLARPTVLATGDRFVLRRPSPPATIGGGKVLAARPRSRWRRLRPATAERFRALSSADPAAVIWQRLSEREPCRADDLPPADTGLEAPERDEALRRLADRGRATRLGELWVTDNGWAALRRRAEALLADHHRRFPLRLGPPTEELRQRLGLTSDAMSAVISQARSDGWLIRDGESIRLPGHDVGFSPAQQAATDELLARFRRTPYRPPSAKEATKQVGEAVLDALMTRGELVAVSADVLFDKEAYDELHRAVLDHLSAHDRITVADLRDRFDTSRRYALAMLEHLDRLRITRRLGDAHVRTGRSADERPAGGGGSDA